MLIVNALRIEPHLSHMNLQESIELAEKVKAKRVFFIHMSHGIGLHKVVNAQLPNNMQLAYDAGADILVFGSKLYEAINRKKFIKEVHNMQ